MEIVPFHKNQSSNNFSYEDILSIAEELRKLSNSEFKGLHKGYFGLHHSQVSNKPFNFFTLSKIGEKSFPSWLIMKPKITGKVRETKYKAKEGCMSFPLRSITTKCRFDEISVSYEIYKNGIFKKEIEKVEEDLRGLAAEIFQHEYDHSIGISIYD